MFLSVIISERLRRQEEAVKEKLVQQELSQRLQTKLHHTEELVKLVSSPR